MRAQVNDFYMAYDDSGKGIPLLLIHGYPLNRKLWEPQVAGLADITRVIAPDLRGHGDTQPIPGPFSPPEPYTMDLLASDCAALLNVIEIQEPVVVCGLSMGGYIALAFFRNYPHRVAALILTATRATADTPEAQENREKAVKKVTEEGVGAVIDEMLPKLLSPSTYSNQPILVQLVNDIMQNTSVNGMIGDLLGMKARPDSTPMLSEINKPTLLLHGMDDQIISLQDMESMREAIPNARFQVIPSAGHLLNLEQPDLFNQAVRNFIQTL